MPNTSLRNFLLSVLTSGDDETVDVRKVADDRQHEMLAAFQQLLRRFKIHWPTLRAIMLSTGAVISGSAVLAVLQPNVFLPQDLDIYVEAGGFAAVLVFLNSQGYNEVEIPAYGVPEEKYPGLVVELKLANKEQGEKIHLVGTTDDHVVKTITRFHSTTVMNFIGYYGIVSLYPEWTMRATGLVVRPQIDQKAINKYQGRGYTMVYVPEELPKFTKDHECGEDQHCPKRRRTLHDGESLVIYFDGGFNINEEEPLTAVWELDGVRDCMKG